MDRADQQTFSKKEVIRWADLFEGERRYYKEILQELPCPVAIINANSNLLATNRNFRNLFELGKDEGHAGIEPSDGLAAAIEKLFQERAPFDGLVCEMRGKQVTVSAVPLYGCDDGDEAVLVIGIDTATAARNQPEAPKLPILVWETGETGGREILIAATEGMAGSIRTAWLAANEQSKPFEAWLEQVHPDDRQRIRDFYANIETIGGRASCEYRFQMGSAWLLLRDAVETNGLKRVGITTDLTRHFQGLQAGLETMRRDAAGRLARTATHELNNTLMIIQGFAEELVPAFGENDTHRKDVEQLLLAAERASAIVNRMQSVYRPTAGKPEQFDLHTLIEAVHAAMGSISSKIHLDLNAGNPIVEFDSRILGLCLKAFLEEAARKLSAEKIDITTRIIVWRSSLAFPGAPVPGDYIALRITAAPQPSITNQLITLEFSPDVCAVHAMAVAVGGCCWLSSPWDQHGLFTLWLPVIPTPVVTQPEVTASKEQITILLVDDEEGIRALERRILERQGFKVMDAACGEEALEILAAHHGKIGMLITDWFMPGINGRELAEQVRQKQPDLPVLLVSGYMDDPEIMAGALPPRTRYLPKPFSLPSLLEAVESLLDR